MSVVQRCPNCGTTQATSGECQACHDAQVRFFCSNHAPGIWLDAPTCAKCGATLGAPAPPASFRPPPAPPPPRRTAPIRHEGSPRREEYELEPPGMALAPWQRLIITALRARHALAGTPERETAAPARSAGSCLLRAVILLVLLLVASIAALLMLGRTLFLAE